MDRKLIAATLVVACACGRSAHAQSATDRSPPSEPAARAGCASSERPLDPDVVVRCALAASPEVREARAQLAAMTGRRAAAGVWLPSNPTVSGTLAVRRRPPPEAAAALNWLVTLSQEFEIAGQRSARVDAVDVEAAARDRRVRVAEQEVAAGVLTAYYEAVAAQEGLRVATDLARTAEALAAYAEGRAKEAVLAGVEADVARAEATRIALVRFEAERRVTAARATLALLIQADPGALALPQAVAPPPAPEGAGAALEERALRLRGEVAAAEMERMVLERRLTVMRRERIPNLTVSAFAEQGEINDRIFGVGLSLPIPLPAPVGRTRAGEIAEAISQIQAAGSSAELVRRRVRVELARATSAYQSRMGASHLFAADLLARARADLSALREAIAARQLSLREALTWQRSLIELLQADIEVRLGSALASVELRRAAGLPLATSPGGRQ
jgi:cobalt-zinc-cadmium efflux system outer membrane protein